MFTGIVEAKGRLTASEAQAFGRRITVDLAGWRGRSGAFYPGDSVAVHGVCLTAAEVSGAQLTFDVIAETLSKTTLGDRAVGDAVNLESSLTAATPIGGHFVQGHVDGVGRVTEVRRGGESQDEWVVTVQPPAELLDFIVPKGAIAIDGVSLTLAAIHDDTFDLALIPTTLNETTLGELTEGARVNLEADMVTKSVVHWLRRQGESAQRGVSWQTLRDAGFLD